jgi:hypothetical protein
MRRRGDQIELEERLVAPPVSNGERQIARFSGELRHVQVSMLTLRSAVAKAIRDLLSEIETISPVAVRPDNAAGLLARLMVKLEGVGSSEGS